jgi:hypothetical protein
MIYLQAGVFAVKKIEKGRAKVIIVHHAADKIEVYFKKLSKGVDAKMTKAESDNLRKEHGFEKQGL